MLIMKISQLKINSAGSTDRDAKGISFSEVIKNCLKFLYIILFLSRVDSILNASRGFGVNKNSCHLVDVIVDSIGRESFAVIEKKALVYRAAMTIRAFLIHI